MKITLNNPAITFALMFVRASSILVLHSAAINIGAQAQSAQSTQSQARAFSLYGKIVCAQAGSAALPLAGIAVTNTQTGEVVLTDKHGEYVFHKLSAGRFYVYPLHGGARFSPVVRTAIVADASSGAAVVATATDIRIPEFIIAEATYSIHGRVTAAQQPNVGVPNVAVTTNEGHTARTDTEGYYVVSGLKYDRTYTIAPLGSSGLSTLPSPQSEWLPASRTVTMNATITKQNFVLGTVEPSREIYKLVFDKTSVTMISSVTKPAVTTTTAD
jgi:hypothetical protein